MRRHRLLPLAVLLLSLPLAVWAQDAGDSPDASLPDASVGSGGADRDNPEQDDNAGRVPTACSTDKDCERGFSCDQGACVYTGVRDADGGGCLSGASALATAFALGVALLSRRRGFSAP